MTITATVPDTAELLCYCEQVSEAQFAQLADEQPGESFAELCARSGVGMACTSCLMNAELAFTERRAQGLGSASAPTATRTKSSRARFGRAAILQFLTDASPKIPTLQRSVCPVVAGGGLRTLLTVSNAYPKTIGAKSARYRLALELRAADGKIVDRQRHRVNPGDKLSIDLADTLPHSDGNDLITGTARLTLSATEPRYRGTVRPHFSIIAEHSSAAVHTANAAARQSALHLISERGGSRNFMQVFNAEPRPATAQIHRFEVDGRPIDTLDRQLAPYGSALIELPRFAASERADTGTIYAAQVDVDAIQRAWMIVASGDMQRVSVDHI